MGPQPAPTASAAQSLSASSREPDVTLRERLRAIYPGTPGRRLKQWLAGARVRLNGAVVFRGDVTVGPDDRVELGSPPPAGFPAPLRLVHEDDHLVVVRDRNRA